MGKLSTDEMETIKEQLGEGEKTQIRVAGFLKNVFCYFVFFLKRILKPFRNHFRQKALWIVPCRLDSLPSEL